MAAPNVHKKAHEQFEARARSQVLIVSNQRHTSANLRQALKSLGYFAVSSVTSHIEGIERIEGRPFSHVLFDASESDMPTIEFVEKVITLEEEATLVAISTQPAIDDVFGLLKAGARGFLVPPFNIDILEEVIQMADEGPVLSEAVLNAPDRNAAFVAMILNNLYRLSVAKRQSSDFESAAVDVASYSQTLKEAVEMALIFCEGGSDSLRDKIVEGCIDRANDASSRLGRLRKRLQKDRAQKKKD